MSWVAEKMRSDVQGLGLAAWFSSLGVALLAASLSLLSSPVQAQGYTLPPAEKVPTFLGIDLPLRPGERLVPIGKGGCSAVVFAPKPEHYEFHRKQLGDWEWAGACRFGLIHGSGSGRLYHPSYGEGLNAVSAVYGTLFYPPRHQDRYGTRYHWAYSGSAFSELNTKQVYLSGSGDIESLDRFEKDSGGLFAIGMIATGIFTDNPRNVFTIILNEFDLTGFAKTISVTSINIANECLIKSESIYRPFESEVRGACSRKAAGQFIILRREGPSILGHENPIVWLKACPLKKGTDQADCPALMRKALGKDYAEMEAIMAGSPAVRPAMMQEIFNRYAPLEAAVEARLKQQAIAGGASR